MKTKGVNLRRFLQYIATVIVIHASHAGPFAGYDSPELPDVDYPSVYLDETMICDARGNILARRSIQEGAGA